MDGESFVPNPHFSTDLERFLYIYIYIYFTDFLNRIYIPNADALPLL
jgi:hypothetical protein